MPHRSAHRAQQQNDRLAVQQRVSRGSGRLIASACDRVASHDDDGI